jgi:hypothetical protein
MTWCIVEPGIYLIASCFPSLRPLLKAAFKNLKIRSFRSIFLSYGSKHTDNNGSVPLSGFNRIHDPLRPGSIGDGNDQKDLVACYRASDSQEDPDELTAEQSDLESGLKGSSPTTIRVRKDYTLSSSPRN